MRNGDTISNIEDEKYIRIIICGADLLNVEKIQFY